jgi:hypothetical protein
LLFSLPQAEAGEWQLKRHPEMGAFNIFINSICKELYG